MENQTETSIDGRRAADSGFTLVEVLVSIVLTGTIVLAVVAAMSVVIQVSAFSDEQAGVEAVLGGAADQLGGIELIPCPDLTGLNSYEEFAKAGAATVGWATDTVIIEQISFWDPDAINWAPTNGVGSEDCNEDVFLSTAKAMQRVRVRVTAPDGSVTRTIDVVISDLRKA